LREQVHHVCARRSTKQREARRVRISRKEGHRFTASRSMVSRHVGPMLMKQDVLNFLSQTIIRQ
jgi:hypothetical protein